MCPLKRIISFLLLAPFLSVIVISQQPNKTDQKADSKAEAQPTPPTLRPTLAFGLSEDTPVRLKLNRTMSSKDATLNEKVDFEILEDVKVGEVVVAQHGGMAIATVTEAKHKGRMGKAGKLNINIDYLLLTSGDKVPLRAIKGGSGGTHTAAMTGAIVATSIVFFPAAPFFLFMHGKDITIPKGTEITAYVAADTPLDRAKFIAAGITSPATNSSGSDDTPISINSSPVGADILIDGKFVGSTPSTVQMKPGEHLVTIEKAGYKPWQRTMTVAVHGSINIDATLDKVP
ncbi:MAG TPA: PEGA domain-containing protein [Pyrinomonadaceae bacterium]|nr:PEGA domain-containing protein [Pyrinomonadaceae bacterium]